MNKGRGGSGERVDSMRPERPLSLSFIFPLTLTISTPVESFHFGSIQLIGNGTCRFYKCLRCTTTRANSHHRKSPPSNVNQERRKLPPPAARAAASRRAPSSIVGRQG